MEALSSNILINDAQREIFDIVNYVVVCSILSVFGLTSNIINIIVFCKQGFSSPANISFCGLAVSDLFSLLAEIWFNVCVNPLIENADISFVPIEVQVLTGGIPCVLFSRITCWITTYITAERWLSIVFPLKVKDIVNPKRTTIIIIAIYVINCLVISPQYFVSYIGWKYYPERNRTLVGLIYRVKDNSDKIVYVSIVIMGLVPFITVSIFTAMLVVKLGQKSAWRTKVTFANEQSKLVSNRDRKTMKMIILIAIILIASYIPGTLVSLVSICNSHFGVFGLQVNMYFVCWSFAFVAQNINASVNIFLYYKMSTKYRQTFWELFSKYLNSENLNRNPGLNNVVVKEKNGKL